MLYDLAQAETTIFVTTHYMDEAEHCQRIAFIYYGRLIANGAPQEIISASVPDDILVFEPPDPMAAEQAIQQALKAGTLPADGVSLFGAAVHVATHDADRTRQAVQKVLADQGIAQDGWRTIRPSLEDAFIALVNRQTQSAAPA